MALSMSQMSARIRNPALDKQCKLCRSLCFIHTTEHRGLPGTSEHSCGPSGPTCMTSRLMPIQKRILCEYLNGSRASREEECRVGVLQWSCCVTCLVPNGHGHARRGLRSNHVQLADLRHTRERLVVQKPSKKTCAPSLSVMQLPVTRSDGGRST